jgi:hypothetical protein
MKMLLLIGLYSSISTANSDPVFTSVSYYDGLGQKFRVELASAWPKCQETKRARKIYLDKPNELREVAYWDQQGKIHEAGKSNNPEVHKMVNEIFAGSQTSENPCVKKNELKPSPALEIPAPSPEESTPVEIDYSHGTPQ